MQKVIAWKHGNNGVQDYYDADVAGDYLLVYENKWNPGVWCGCISRNGGGMCSIYNKTFNDRQRKLQGLSLGCDVSMLSTVALLTHSTPEYMMKKVERCYRRNKYEICQ